RQVFNGCILPAENAAEAAMITGLDVYGCRDLQEVSRFLSGELALRPQPYTAENERPAPTDGKDFAEVRGQDSAKRALEIAAAGGHNVLLVGPPGSGKTMLASRMPGILPPLSPEEAIETTKIHSVAGQLDTAASLLRCRPFRAPHHTISHTAMVGGGSYPLPGEISLAHNGVLFLDELPEFQRSTLEVLRQPLEEGRIAIARTKLRVEYPAGFTLVCAMNPCPCGYYNHPERACTCRPNQIHKYLAKISGPLLDRIDLQVQVAPVPYADLSQRAAGRPADSSAQIRTRVVAARERQKRRFSRSGENALHTNAQMQGQQLERFCHVDAAGEALLEQAAHAYRLSARAYHRILKVARTIA
ncbi:MAG: YifB family Mg chelatase-like AAA ATPase, partial [Bacteroidales bacterium]|nr:YifB family Mg chelatase-like AAA ATPase [Bacteroidales bacterium]